MTAQGCHSSWGRSAAAFMLAAASLTTTSLSAQGTGRISGVATDAFGAPIISAQVTFSGMPWQVFTDDSGAFVLNGVPFGSGTLTLRRLGFVPLSLNVSVSAANPAIGGLAVQLTHLPTLLQAVTVEAKRVSYSGRLAGYYQRLEKRNNGYFITRDQINRENPRGLAQLLQHVPAITASRMRGGGSGVRMRGRTCAPLVWLDGTPMPAGELDLNAISPQTIQGIELYLGSTTAPSRFVLNRDANSCGTIILWSRGPDTDPMKSGKPSQDLVGLLASLSVFTVDQVDNKAQLTGSDLQVSYPPPLFAEGIGGSVLAEFVVDTTGKVEEGTFGIVSSTNPLFSEAVREAVESATYSPAQRNSLRVRQLIQQPFSFIPPRKRSGG
jgi:TonB family protein